MTLPRHARFGRAIGLALGVLGMLDYQDGDYASAGRFLEEAVEQLDSAGMPVAVA